MSKEIALICENPQECEVYTHMAQIIANSGEIDVCIIPNPIPDKNAYDTAIFVFANEVSNNCPPLNCWVGHQHIVTISGDTADYKLERFAKVFRHICGIPAPLEIERKFLIKYPDISELEAMDNCCAVGISQTYLDIPDANVRLRKRTVDGVCTHIRTEKSKLTDITRVETESVISDEEYEKLMTYKHPHMDTIDKTRYCLMYNGSYLEIDVFPFWNDKAYLEAELISEDESVDLPPFIEVIKEVTTDKRYTNKSLAQLLNRNEINNMD